MVTVTQFGDLNGDGTTDVIAGGCGQPDDDRPLVAIERVRAACWSRAYRT